MKKFTHFLISKKERKKQVYFFLRKKKQVYALSINMLMIDILYTFMVSKQLLLRIKNNLQL